MVLKYESKFVPGAGPVKATIDEVRRADGTVHVRVLVEAHYTQSGKPIDPDVRDIVAAAFNAVD